MLTIRQIDVTHSSNHSTWLILAVQSIYIKLKKTLNSLSVIFGDFLFLIAIIPIAILALLFIGVPVFAILLLTMKFLTFRLRKAVENTKIVITHKNYKSIKTLHRETIHDLKKIDEVLNLMRKETIFLAPIFINDTQETYNIINSLSLNLAKELSKLNSSSNKSSIFEFIHEDKLWNRRVEVYDYLI